VVAHDQGQRRLELTGAMAPQQVLQAVVELRNEERYPRHVIAEAQLPRHPEPLGDGPERRGDLCARKAERGEVPFDALQEDPLLEVRVLVGVDDVAVVAVDEVGHRGDEALLIGARQQQDGAHGPILVQHRASDVAVLHGRRRQLQHVADPGGSVSVRVCRAGRPARHLDT
jgi:hypothetical protein